MHAERAPFYHGRDPRRTASIELPAVLGWFIYGLVMSGAASIEESIVLVSAAQLPGSSEEHCRPGPLISRSTTAVSSNVLARANEAQRQRYKVDLYNSVMTLLMIHEQILYKNPGSI